MGAGGAEPPHFNHCLSYIESEGSNFQADLLMLVPFDPERLNSVGYHVCEECISCGSVTPLPQGGGVPALPSSRGWGRIV